jgi:vancomycin resistance protein YoaR
MSKKKAIVEDVEKVPRPKKARTLYVVVTSTVLLLLASATAYAFEYSHRILPRTFISGVAVGGMNKQQAIQRLASKRTTFLSTSLTADYQTKSWHIKPSDFELSVLTDPSVTTAYNNGRGGGILKQIRELAVAPFRPSYYGVIIQPITESGRKQLQAKILTEIEHPTAETNLDFTPGHVTVVPGKVGQRLNYNSFESDLLTAFEQNNQSIDLKLIDFNPEVTVAQAENARVQADQILNADWHVKLGDQSLTVTPKEIAPWLTTTISRDSSGRVSGLGLALSQDAISKYVGDNVSKAEHKPVNAKLKVDNGVVVIDQDAKDGVKVIKDKTAADISEGLLAPTLESSRTIVGVVALDQAGIRRDNLDQQGIKEMIGTATTDFSGSPANRTFNIGLGQRSLNGGIVKDGEAYSTIGTLGPIEESTGYLPELVIKDNRTIPEAGGGLCQVSTTLFRSVLNAGLPVTERTNHAYRVGYYERGVGPGLDATVYDPQPDFKWRNDTGHAVYIQSYIVGTQITFELYGTKDGRTSVISPVQILEESPPGDPLHIETDSLFKGEVKQVETAHGGAKTLVTYTVSRDGKQVNQQKFYSNYRPWPAQFLVGTKDRPAA